jgi:stage III sporulation protein AH
MNMNKQTVWLVTMLTLMVVLSAYYIVTGPVEPAGPATVSEDSGQDADVKTQEKEQPQEEKAGAEEQAASKKAESDYFVGYQLQRNSLRSKMTEEYMQILTDPEASEKELAEARAKIDELMKVDKSESVMEELIREEGYRDVVVITNDSNFVDVIVQSEKLTNEQVVKLISLVKQHMDVSAQHVSVAYRD